MNIDDVILQFTTAVHTLPKAAMQWALDNWTEAAPRFLDLLSRHASTDAGERTREDADTLFFIVYLLAEKGEKAAFRPLCRLMQDDDALGDVIGDGVTTNLPSLLVNLYDGDLALLKTVIETGSANEFIRNAAFGALAYLTFSGAIPLEDTRATLRRLHETMQPQEENYAWVGLIDAISAVGLDDLRPIAVDVMERGLVSPSIMGMNHFDGDLESTLNDPERRACFVRDGIGPFGSAIAELSRWYSFSEEQRKDLARQETKRNSEPRYPPAAAAALVNPFKGVGRNDPCPCGSGKKFKKCCLP
ncbi:MAG: DUF1186 domain-containing protein [Alphaproteobacteria bacterium]